MATSMTFSHFLRHSGSALAQVGKEDIVLERRDGDDLVLKLVEREQSEKESLVASGRLVALLLERADTRQAVLDAFEGAFPWSRFLPDIDRDAFAADFARTVEAAAGVESFVSVGVMIRQWKNTARVWADPALRARLQTGDVEPGPAVPRPALEP